MRTPLAVALALALAAGCSALKPASSERPNLYSLAGAEVPAAVALTARAPASAMTLVVAPPHAAAGFDSRRIIYLLQADQPEYFAQNEWVDTPARMLTPLIVAAAESSGAFHAVVSTPSPATGEMRLDTEILRLQHDFTSKPSRVRFTLRAYLMESATRKVIATREFDAVVPSASEDPHGGVVAASKAVRQVLGELSAFCASRARR